MTAHLDRLYNLLGRGGLDMSSYISQFGPVYLSDLPPVQLFKSHREPPSAQIVTMFWGARVWDGMRCLGADGRGRGWPYHQIYEALQANRRPLSVVANLN